MYDDPLPGLVWAFHFPPGAPPRALAEAACAPAGLPDDGFVWLHVNQADARLDLRLGQLRLVPPAAEAALAARDRHLFLSAGPAVVVGQLPDFRHDLSEQGNEIDAFRFAATDRILITSRKHPLRSMATLRHAIEAGRRFDGPLALVGALGEAFEAALESLVAAHAERIDAIEDEVFNDRPADQDVRLGPIRRDVLRLHRTLRTTARLYHRLDAFAPEEMTATARSIFEQRGHHLASLDQDVVELAERARLLREEIDTQRGKETNRHLYILSVATSLLLPPTLVTGFFGMNTKDMYLQDVGAGTTYALALVAAAGIGAWFALRRVGVTF